MEQSIRELIGNKELITKRDYAVCITAFLGYTPTDFEISLLFHDNLTLPLEELMKILKYHDSAVDKELRLIEIFRLLDSAGKGFISVDDVREIWKTEAPYLNWDYVSTCFREMSIDNRIFYDSLKDMFLSLDEN